MLGKRATYQGGSIFKVKNIWMIVHLDSKHFNQNLPKTCENIFELTVSLKKGHGISERYI
jgi:hypothetical protein